MEQIISMYAANSSKPETVGGIIEILEKHQESLKAAAAKVYVLHAKVSSPLTFIENIGHESRLTPALTFSGRAACS